MSPLTQDFRNTIINAVNTFAYWNNLRHAQWLNTHWAISGSPMSLGAGPDYLNSVGGNFLYIWSGQPAAFIKSNIRPLAYTLQNAVTIQKYTSVITYDDCIFGVTDVPASDNVTNINVWGGQPTLCGLRTLNTVQLIQVIKHVNPHKRLRRVIHGYNYEHQLYSYTTSPFTIETFNRSSNLYEWAAMPPAYFNDINRTYVLPATIRQKLAIVYRMAVSPNTMQMFSLLETDADIAIARNVSVESARNLSNFYTAGSIWVDSRAPMIDNHGIMQAGRMPSSLWRNSSNGIGANNTRWDDMMLNKNFLCGLATNGSVQCWGTSYQVGWQVRVEWRGYIRTYYYGNGHGPNFPNLPDYVVVSPPSEFAPYKAICATILYACAITNSSTVLCFMGPYGRGSPLAMFHSDIDLHPDSTANVAGELSMNTSSLDNQTFTQITCADLMVCALTSGGRIFCSAPPLTRLRYVQSSATPRPPVSAIIYPPTTIGETDESANMQIVQLAALGDMLYFTQGGDWMQPVCFVRRNGNAECVSNDEVLRSLPAVTALAPRGYYQLAGGTETVQCPGSTYSHTVGATSAACSGPCAAGYAGSTDRATSLTFTDETCNKTCPLGHYCPLGNDGPIPCPAGTFGNITGLKSSDCSGPCGIGTYCPAGSSAPTDCPAGTYGDDVGLSTELCSGRCRPGTFAQEKGSRVCLACQANSYSLNNGTIICTQCSEIGDGVGCANGIAEIDMFHHASVIVERSASNASELTLRLKTIDCPFGYCNGTNSSNIDTNRLTEYQQSNNTAPMQFSLSQQCTTNRDQSSQPSLCGQCIAGYAPSDIGAAESGCVPCTQLSGGKLALFILGPLFFTLVYYIAANGRLGALGQFLYFVQTIAIMVSSQSKISSLLNVFNISPWTIFALDACLANMSPELQYSLPLFVPFMQVLHLIIIVLIQICIKKLIDKSDWSSQYKLDMLTMTYVKINESAAYGTAK